MNINGGKTIHISRSNPPRKRVHTLPINGTNYIDPSEKRRLEFKNSFYKNVKF